MRYRFLLDTNVLSEPLRAAPDRRTMARLRQNEGAIATAAPVWHELVFGAARLQRSKKRRALERYLEMLASTSLAVLPYDANAAVWHGQERARLTNHGAPPPFCDGQIAAIAAVNGLTLVTRNVTDFARFHDLDVQDWSR